MQAQIWKKAKIIFKVIGIAVLMMALLVVAWLCVFYYRADEGNVATICEFDAQNQRYTVERYIVKDGEHIPLESSNPEQICTRLERDAQF